MIYTYRAFCYNKLHLTMTEHNIFSDINECKMGVPVCHVNATCYNTPGSYVCTCDSGFYGDGVTCTGIHPKHSCYTNFLVLI